MKKTAIRVCVASVVCLLPCSHCLFAMVSQQAASQATPQAAGNVAGNAPNIAEAEAVPAGQVEIEGRPVLTVYEPIGTLTPSARAEAIAGRVLHVAQDSNILPDAIHLQPRDAWTEIVADGLMIMAVTEADAKGAGKSREELAQEDAGNIRQAVVTYRQEHSWRMLFRGAVKAAVATLVLLIAFWLVRRLSSFLRNQVGKRIRSNIIQGQKSAWHIFVGYLGPIVLTLGSILRWFVILALLEAYLTVTLSFFSATREISLTTTAWVLSQLKFLATSLVDYLPNLLLIAVITIITYYVIRLIRLISVKVREGDLSIRGFYPDWAEPTEKLIRVMVIALALVVAFPYLPGAKSPAFRGISIFLGVLLSLGSSSAVANAISGVILTYMRSFLIGDWVQIGDTMGEVIERNLLVTRLLTPKAEIIAIPNATIMSGPVKNYSIEAKKAGVILYTTVSIGYSTPWEKVHELLRSAAVATTHVLKSPEPFVLQRALNDFYVSYELNAYTDTPREVLNIFSELHQNIQNRFNDAGVEICSPHFAALRDGNAVSMPEEYLRSGSKVPGFRVGPMETNSDTAHRE
jgi:small-conductance mechanosensitive channel